MSATPRLKKSKKNLAPKSIQERMDNTLLKVKTELWQELRDKLEEKYLSDGELNIAKIQEAWYKLSTAKKIRHEEPPHQQTLRNFRKEEPKPRKYWLIDGLCQLLLDCSFEDWLVDAVPRRITQDVEDDFVEQFNQGRVWLLLDGLDEMATGSVSALDDLKQQLASSFVARARVVLTCRLNVWDSNLNALETFETYRTLEVSYPEQVGQFIDSWFKKIDPERGQRLKTALAQPEKERIQDLVKNPLRLALLCRTWQREEEDLPDTKANLYQQFVDDLYWWKWKYEGFRTTDPQRQELKAKLGQLARDAIAQESSRFRLTESFICGFLDDPHEEGSLFWLACKLGWLNHVGVAAEDTAKSVYAFFHPTFQEYFAACAIPDWDYFLNHNSENPNPFLKYNGKDCVYRIFESQWKEVILLWLGREDVLKEQKENFIGALVRFRDGCQEWLFDYKGFYEYRAYFLAAAAAIAEFKESKFSNEIVRQLVKWGFGTEIRESSWSDEAVEQLVKDGGWQSYAPYRIGEKAKAVLQETDRLRVIDILIELIQTSPVKDIRYEAIEILGEVGMDNPELKSVFINLIDNSPDDYIRMKAAERDYRKD